MLKKNFTVALAVLLTYSMIWVQPTSAATNAEKQARLTQKVKEGVSRLGVGKDALVKVTLRDRSKLTGYISEIGTNCFVVADSKTGKESAPAYADVTQVKGHNLSTGAKVAIGVAVGVAAYIVVMLFLWLETDN